ncbi:MAG: Riboflavin biosynthesis protein RibF [Phycisphaerae bacterium]|nr:Riboflavin biosynthesis protein RibF [Phycisphaerae bacterium]
MRKIDGLEHAAPLPGGCVLTVGNFDGVHRAHQHLLKYAKTLAEVRLPLVVLTFEPHPLTIIAPHRAPQRLTPPDERLRWIEACGADAVVVARSDPALLAMTAADFVEHVLVSRFRPKHVIEGPTFGFGRDRTGTNELLAALGVRFGFAAHVIPPLCLPVDGAERAISSSLIRECLAAGRLEVANAALGRPYALIGRVVPGDARGRTLGFPTANLDCGDQLVPADGVYAARAHTPSGRRPAAVNIGAARTFGGADRRIEAHLLDFNGDLYDASLRLELLKFLRNQRTFASADALKTQVMHDLDDVRACVEPEAETVLG